MGSGGPQGASSWCDSALGAARLPLAGLTRVAWAGCSRLPLSATPAAGCTGGSAAARALFSRGKPRRAPRIPGPWHWARGPSSPAPAESVPVDPARTGRRLRVDFRRLGVDCTLNGRLRDGDEPGPVPFGVAFDRGKCSQKTDIRALSAEESERSVFHKGRRPIEAAIVHRANPVVRHCAAKAAG